MGFKDVFESSQDGQGDFKQVPNGAYNLTLEKFETKPNDTGSVSINEGWSIVDGDFAGQWVFQRMNTLVNRDGALNEIGIRNLNKRLTDLSSGSFSVESFASDEDEYGLPNNIDDVLAKFLDTVITAQLIVKQDGEYVNNNIKVRRVTTNAYQNNSNGVASSTPTAAPTANNGAANTSTPPAAQTADGSDHQQYGDEHINAPFVILQNGKQSYGRLASFQPNPQNPNEGMCVFNLVDFDKNDPSTHTFMQMNGKTAVSKHSEAMLVTDLFEKEKAAKAAGAAMEETIVEEEEIIDEPAGFSVGQEVSYLFQGRTLNGKIEQVLENEQLVTFIVQKEDGKKARRKVAFSDVTPF